MHDNTGKYCPSCTAFKPIADYHMNRATADGRQRYCKPCQNRRCRESRRATRSEGSRSSSSEISDFGTEAIPAGYDLYVITNPRIPGEYKVGRSKGVEQRRDDLQNGQNFRMEVVATFPGNGYAEGLVHGRLAHSRVHEGAGREWFRASLSDVLHAIGRVLESEMP